MVHNRAFLRPVIKISVPVPTTFSAVYWVGNLCTMGKSSFSLDLITGKTFRLKPFAREIAVHYFVIIYLLHHFFR